MRTRLLLTCAALACALWALAPLPSLGASPGGRLGRIQNKIDTTQGKIERRRGTERVLTTQISAYTQRIRALQGRIDGLQRRQAAVEADLARKRAELDRIQGRLRAERALLLRLRARLVEARAALAQRLRELYEADQPDIVTVILSADGFADLLERGEFMQRVSEQDRVIFTHVREAKARAVATEARLEGLERRQRAVTRVVLARRDEIATVKRGLIGTRSGLDRARAGRRRVLARVRDSRHHLEGALSGLREEQARIQAALRRAQARAAGAIRHGSGALIWPVNGPITSPFCEARAWERCHPGIDIGVPAGTPIRAAAAGRVVLVQGAGASGGYGNFTCVQHTSVLSTCYAHQSRFATHVGANVSQGQVIGYVGCTGLCFGDHLHFEVRVNGAVTNPLNYL
jgi:peptidoglycan DL-endopeptidase CwlO